MKYFEYLFYFLYFTLNQIYNLTLKLYYKQPFISINPFYILNGLMLCFEGVNFEGVKRKSKYMEKQKFDHHLYRFP